MRADIVSNTQIGMLTVLERRRPRGFTTFYKLRCECGKEFEIRAGEWKPSMVDCGCGSQYLQTTIRATFLLPYKLDERMYRYARERGVSTNAVVVELLDAALPEEEHEN